MATDTLTLKFKGIDEVSPATKSIGTSLDGLGKSAGAIAKGALAAVAVGAAAISVELYSAAKAAMEAEENMQRLKKALENSGQAAKANLDALVDQSAELQRTTRYSDDAVQSLQALALNLGASADETKLITLASLDMAAALGTDAESAAKALTLSLSGNSTALGKLIPEVKTMTDEQLAHGAAIELVAKKYRGFAENEGQTFAGTLAKVSNAFGDLQEEIGAIFTDNEGLKDTLAGLVPILDDIKSLVTDNKNGLRDMVTYGLTLAVNGFATLAEGGVVLVDTLFALMEGYKRAAIALDEFNQKITPWETSGISERIADAKTELAGIVSMRAQFAETGTKIFGIAEAAKELAAEAGKSNYVQEQTSIVMDEVTVKTDRYAKRMAAMKKETKEAAAATWDYSDAIKEQAEMMDFVNSQSLQNIPTQIQNDAAKNAATPDYAGILQSAGSGSLTGMIQSAVAVAVPGIGAAIAAAVGPVLELMATGDRASMDQFFQKMVDQLVNIIGNIDDIINSAISHIDDIIVGVVSALSELVIQLPIILVETIGSIGEMIGGIFTGLGKTFVDIGTTIYEGITGTTLAVEKGNAWRAKDAASQAGYFTESDVRSDYGHGLISAGEAAEYIRAIRAYESSSAADQALLTEGRYGGTTYGTTPGGTAYQGHSIGAAPRAFGGPVTAGESYVVGDGQDGSMRNAEIFTPKTSGTISKADAGSSGGDLIINITEATNPHHIAQMVSNAVGYLVDTKKWRFDPRRNMAVA